MLRPRRVDHPAPEPDPDPGSSLLARRLRDGESMAFNVVVAQQWRRTVAYAFALLDDRDLACDVAQEAFVRLWQARARLDPERPLVPWLLKITRNLCVNERRKLEVRWRWAAQQRQSDQVEPSTPLQDLEIRELNTAIMRAIKSLPPRRREVFTLFHLQKLSYREIAQVMDIRPQSAANHVQAAIADLRTALADYFPHFARTPEHP